MPLEISEIGVRLAVGPTPATPVNPSAEHPTAPVEPGAGPGAPAAITPTQEEQITAAAVKEVLTELREEQAR